MLWVGVQDMSFRGAESQDNASPEMHGWVRSLRLFCQRLRSLEGHDLWEETFGSHSNRRIYRCNIPNLEAPLLRNWLVVIAGTEKDGLTRIKELALYNKKPNGETTSSYTVG